jgi:glycosyltransferase involved in cell wall biosynthesis
VSVADVGILLDRPDRSLFLAKGLRERGFKVTVYNNVPGSTDHTKIRERFSQLLLQTLSHTRHDIYLTSMLFNPALVLYLNRILARRPYIYTFNGADWHIFKDLSPHLPFPRLRENYLYPFLLSRIFHAARHVICNSDYLRQEVQARFPKLQDRLSTIYNGIDFDRFSPPASKKKKSYVQLISVTTWKFENKSKGAFLLIDAMERILRLRRDVRLIVAAKTDGRRYYKLIEQYLASKPWKDSISLVYDHPHVEDLLKASDIFICSIPPDSNDSLPRVIIEAQAVGLPVVATATAGCAEAVKDGETGFIVPYNADALASRVLELMGSPDLSERFGQRAESEVRRTFSWDTMTESYANVILNNLNAGT